MASTVALLRCPDYDPDHVEACVRQAVNLLGGMQQYVHPGQRVLVKPNLLLPSPPERAIVTHPAVVRAVVRLAQEAGGRVLIGDNVGSSSALKDWARSYEVIGLAAVVAETGAELNFEFQARQRPAPTGRLLKMIDVSGFVAEADVVISVSKLKTHSLMRFTGAVKNLFGTVPGMSKFAYHAKLPTVDQFAEMLLDVARSVGAALHVMDAVVGMDGHGPSAGDPFPIGAILAGTDPVAVDIAALALVGCDPLTVPTVAAAVHRGWPGVRPPVPGWPGVRLPVPGWPGGITGHVADLELLGDSLPSLQVNGFRLPAGGRRDLAFVPQFLRSWGVRYMVARPVVATERCTGCGTCIANCPVQTIHRVGGRARILAQRCIYCYCCHETCPEKAIDLHRPLVSKLLARF